MQEFTPAALTPERVSQLAAVVFPDRVGTAIWINLKTGEPDEGMAIEVFRKDKISGDALLGHASFGASLGYDVVTRGNIVVTAFGGISHPWTMTLQRGWSPVAGLRVRF